VAALVARVEDRGPRAERVERLIADQARGRALQVARWPQGEPCRWGLLCEAWAVYRFGAAELGSGGVGPLLGPKRPGLAARAERAITIYEAQADQRPPNWPAGGAAALTVVGAQRKAATLGGEVSRLLVLAKQMRAAARLGNPSRLDRLRRRARGPSRVAPTAPARDRGAAPPPAARRAAADRRRPRRVDQRGGAAQTPRPPPARVGAARARWSIPN
jgi:hypothetical protein